MKKHQGFTLIELLIVVAIIAILAAIAVPNFLEAQVRSKVSRCKADMRSLATALEAYRIDSTNYPPMFDTGWGGVWIPLTEPPFHAKIPNYLTTPIAFITSLPHDPFSDFSQWLSWAAGTDFNQRFCYWNYPQFLDANPTSTTFRNRMNDAGYWLFYSPGPDLSVSNAPATTYYINYDPTNGTVSLGNIFRTHKTGDLYIRGTW